MTAAAATPSEINPTVEMSDSNNNDHHHLHHPDTDMDPLSVSDRITTTTNDDNDTEISLTLLQKTQAVIRMEKILTETIEKVEPWLTSTSSQKNKNKKNSNNYQNQLLRQHNKRVRPLPSTLLEADHVLDVARNLSSRTSAPAGWNPNAPVVGFSTPNPLPYHLRQGSLAALQLERARYQIEYEKKQKQMQLQQQQQQKKMDVGSGSASGGGVDKTIEPVLTKQQQQALEQARMDAAKRNAVFQQQRTTAPKQDISMNLSDDDDDDSDDDSD